MLIPESPTPRDDACAGASGSEEEPRVNLGRRGCSTRFADRSSQIEQFRAPATGAFAIERCAYRRHYQRLATWSTLF